MKRYNTILNLESVRFLRFCTEYPLCFLMLFGILMRITTHSKITTVKDFVIIY